MLRIDPNTALQSKQLIRDTLSQLDQAFTRLSSQEISTIHLNALFHMSDIASYDKRARQLDREILTLLTKLGSLGIPPSLTDDYIKKAYVLTLEKVLAKLKLLDLPKQNILKLLASTGTQINHYWAQLQSASDMETLMAEINDDLVNSLDKFIKDEFMLKAFAGDYAWFESMAVEKIMKKKESRDPVFSDYRHLLLNSTPTYLMISQPAHFLLFDQMVKLLDALKACKGETHKARFRAMMKILSSFSSPDWAIETDVTKLLSSQVMTALPHLVKQQIENIAQQYQANRSLHTARFLSVLENYYIQLEIGISKRNTFIKSARQDFTAGSVEDRGHAVKNSPQLFYSAPEKLQHPCQDESWTMINETSATLNRVYTKATQWIFGWMDNTASVSSAGNTHRKATSLHHHATTPNRFK